MLNRQKLLAPAAPTVTDLAAFPGVAVIRAFTEADRPVCQRIAAEAARSSYVSAMPELASRFVPEAPLEPAERRWVAVWGGHVVGFVDLTGNHIENIFVAPAAQGRGVGRSLIETVEQNTCGDLTLSVFIVNPRARRLYERLGFAVETGGDRHLSRRPNVHLAHAEAQTPYAEVSAGCVRLRRSPR